MTIFGQCHIVLNNNVFCLLVLSGTKFSFGLFTQHYVKTIVFVCCMCGKHVCNFCIITAFSALHLVERLSCWK